MLLSQLLEQTKTPYLFFNRFFGTGKCSPGALFSDHISWSIGATNSSLNDPFFRQEKKKNCVNFTTFKMSLCCGYQPVP